MQTPRPHLHASRVAVPAALRAQIARLDVELGRAATLRILGISAHTFADVLTPGGIAQPRVLARIEAALVAYAAPAVVTATK